MTTTAIASKATTVAATSTRKTTRIGQVETAETAGTPDIEAATPSTDRGGGQFNIGARDRH
ncbi:hypothetical protein GCM10027456_53390 [Kineosporia babensis]